MATETHKTQLSIGQLLPNFSLAGANRHGQLGPSDYKQHRNLVLIFFHSAECEKCKHLLRQIAERYEDYKEKEAEVLAVAPDDIDRLRQLARELALPFPVLSDSDARVTNLYMEQTEPAAPAATREAAISKSGLNNLRTPPCGYCHRRLLLRLASCAVQ